MVSVTFADVKEHDETAPLLANYAQTEPDSDDVEVGGGPSRLHRKCPRTVALGRVGVRRSYSGDRPLLARQRAYRTGSTTRQVLTLLGVLTLVICLICVGTLTRGTNHPTGPYPRPPSIPIGGNQYTKQRNPAVLVEATHGAVATENRDCSLIGVDVLKDGGNAVDAAIASVLCIGVVNFFSSNIGGGGFMTVRIPPTDGQNSTAWTVDFREMAPALANKTMYVNDTMASKFGGLAVGIPGEVKGLGEAHHRWGKLPWSRLVQPSVDLASGWIVGPELGRRIEMFAPLLMGDPQWQSLFAPNGRLLRAGDPIKRTNYSRTLAAIAAEGPDAFYEGPIAQAIVDAANARGGILTLEDMKSYYVKVLPALQGTYKDRIVYTTHAPTSGPAMLHILNLLERFDLQGEGRTGLSVHRVVEAMKFGFAARTRIGDPDFLNDTSSIEGMSTKAYADKIFPMITDDTTHPPEYYNPVFDVPEDHGTSHTSVLDKDGMAVAVTSSVNLVFGSEVLDPVTGILLNDEMDDFSTPGIPNAFGLQPSPFNYPEPGKRPLSSMTPTIMEYPDGSFYLSVGGSGGSRIFPSVLQVILGIDDWGLDVSQAIEFGRVHDQLYPLQVDVDDIYPEDGINALLERGHNVTLSDISRIAAVVQAVTKQGDKIYAASDSRKNGIAAGY